MNMHHLFFCHGGIKLGLDNVEFFLFFVQLGLGLIQVGHRLVQLSLLDDQVRLET